jgi:hypothetical protein
MKTTYTKKDAKQCKATIKAVACYWSDEPCTYVGKIEYRDNGVLLFTTDTMIYRLREEDALGDAVAILKYDGMWV